MRLLSTVSDRFAKCGAASSANGVRSRREDKRERIADTDGAGEESLSEAVGCSQRFKLRWMKRDLDSRCSRACLCGWAFALGLEEVEEVGAAEDGLSKPMSKVPPLVDTGAVF